MLYIEEIPVEEVEFYVVLYWIRQLRRDIDLWHGGGNTVEFDEGLQPEELQGRG